MGGMCIERSGISPRPSSEGGEKNRGEPGGQQNESSQQRDGMLGSQTYLLACKHLFIVGFRRLMERKDRHLTLLF